MKNHRLIPVLALTSALAFTGCISSNKTEYVDEERSSVAFESPKAEADFFAASDRRKSSLGRMERPEERTTLFLVVVNVSRKKITSGPNRDFNQSVRLCDTDKDNRITEREAQAYLDNSPAAPVRPGTAPADAAIKAN